MVAIKIGVYIMSIILRAIERDDLDKLYIWRNDETIFSQLGGGYSPTSKTEMEKWMDNFTKNTMSAKRFIIEYETKAIGYISLNNINYINQNGELGIYIGEKDHHGKGLASQAISKLEEYAINHLNLKKIKLLVNENNKPAINLYKKLGYVIVGKLNDERYIYEEWINVLIMEKML